MTIISRKLFFNSMIRALLEAYLKFSISTWISVKVLSIDTTSEIINAWLTIFFVVVIVGFPAFTYFFLKKYRARLEEEDFKGRFESLYLNVDTERTIALMALFIFRRLVYAANIVFFAGSTILQIFVQFFCCLLMLLFFTYIHPMNQPFLNRMEMFNEVCLLICSYFLFAFTDFVPDANTRYMYGWAVIGVAVFNIGCNWCALFYKVYLAVRYMIRKFLYERRVKKYLEAKELKAASMAPTGTIQT